MNKFFSYINFINFIFIKKMNLEIIEREKKRNLKCEECELIPNISLYNYKDIKLNLVCDEGHSNNFNLKDYIKKIKKI